MSKEIRRPSIKINKEKAGEVRAILEEMLTGNIPHATFVEIADQTGLARHQIKNQAENINFRQRLNEQKRKNIKNGESNKPRRISKAQIAKVHAALEAMLEGTAPRVSFAELAEKLGFDREQVAFQARKIGYKRRLEEKGVDTSGRHDRGEELVAFLRESVSNVIEGGAVIFPSNQRLHELFGINESLIRRRARERSMQADIAKARALSKERKLEIRDQKLLRWIQTVTDDFIPTISSAANVFGLDRSSVTIILNKYGILDEIKAQTTVALEREREKQKEKTRQRHERLRQEKEEEKRIELDYSEELAWFTGAIVAGGRLSGAKEKPTGIVFSINKFDPNVHAALQSSGQRFMGTEGVPRDRSSESKGKELYFYNTLFVNGLGSFHHEEIADTLRSEKYQWLLEPPYIKPYLEGMVDIRGHIYDNRRMCLSTSNLELARYYREVLLKYGIENSYLYFKDTEHKELAGVRVQNKKDLRLLGELHAKDPKKQKKLDRIRNR